MMYIMLYNHMMILLLCHYNCWFVMPVTMLLLCKGTQYVILKRLFGFVYAERFFDKKFKIEVKYLLSNKHCWNLSWVLKEQMIQIVCFSWWFKFQPRRGTSFSRRSGMLVGISDYRLSQDQVQK